MKSLKSKIAKMAVDFWNDEEAQGMMEYILLAVVVIGIITVAKDPIMNMIKNKTDSLASDVDGFTAQ